GTRAWRTSPTSAACSAARSAFSTGAPVTASVERRGEAQRPAQGAAGIAQQAAAEAAAAEGAPVGQRHPVAPALHLRVAQAHVQRTRRVGAKRRAALELALTPHRLRAGRAAAAGNRSNGMREAPDRGLRASVTALLDAQMTRARCRPRRPGSVSPEVVTVSCGIFGLIPLKLKSWPRHRHNRALSL